MTMTVIKRKVWKNRKMKTKEPSVTSKREFCWSAMNERGNSRISDGWQEVKRRGLKTERLNETGDGQADQAPVTAKRSMVRIQQTLVTSVVDDK